MIRLKYLKYSNIKWHRLAYQIKVLGSLIAFEFAFAFEFYF